MTLTIPSPISDQAGAAIGDTTYECNNEACGWRGKRDDTVHPKHDASTLLCPQCYETTESTAPTTGIAPVAGNGMEQAFSSAAMSRRDELDLPGATVYIDRFVSALGLLCRSKPPRELCEQWLSNESEELQSFAVSNARIYWMTGIGIIEAAQIMADNPEEGAAHEGYTSDYAASASPAASVLTDAVHLTIETIIRQLDLIAERAPDKYLDKTPVVRSLTAHKNRLEKALLAASIGGNKS